LHEQLAARAVAGIRVDRFDHIWVATPGSLDKRDLAAQQNPPQAKQ
jgi:hypothetical protein